MSLFAAICPTQTVNSKLVVWRPDSISFHGVHHVGLLVQDLEKSKEFYCDTLG